MELARFLLYPFALIYGLGVFIRNKFFDWGIVRSVSYPIPLISVGNLAVGGSGKTPLVEYIIRMLRGKKKTATLSRGYKRKTSGFVLASADATAEKIGDEPLQYAGKFEDLAVAVDENRRHGIELLMKQVPGLEAVILDDAFQHRYVQPALSIIVTDYHRIYSSDRLLPVGRLREPVKGSRRADIIVVSKTPKIFSPIVRRQILHDLKPAIHQLVCFSYLSYDEWLPVYLQQSPLTAENRKVNTILMVTGIAFPAPMEEYLMPFCSDLVKLEFGDHHEFTLKDILLIRNTFLSLPTRRKLIVTTEKDCMRLRSVLAEPVLNELPVYYLPIRVNFHKEDREAFEEAIRSVVNPKKPG